MLRTMNKWLLNLTTCIALVAFSPSSWALDIYHCTGSQGEPIYSEKPCANTPEPAATPVVENTALEQVKRDIITKKRTLMNLEREYQYNRGKIDIEHAPELTRQYALRSLEVQAELEHLQGIRMKLIEAAIDTYLGQVSE